MITKKNEEEKDGELPDSDNLLTKGDEAFAMFYFPPDDDEDSEDGEAT